MFIHVGILHKQTINNEGFTELEIVPEIADQKNGRLEIEESIQDSGCWRNL